MTSETATNTLAEIWRLGEKEFPGDGVKIELRILHSLFGKAEREFDWLEPLTKHLTESVSPKELKHALEKMHLSLVDPDFIVEAFMTASPRFRETLIKQKRDLLEKQRIEKLEQEKAEKAEKRRKKYLDERKKSKRLEDKKKAKEKINQEILGRFCQAGIKSLWHMTGLSNLQNIFKSGGLLCKHETDRQTLLRRDISDEEVQDRRSHIHDGVYHKPLHDYVPLYFNAKNPMLYRRKEMQHEICVIEISSRCLVFEGCVVTDGNAASNTSTFYLPTDGVDKIDWSLIGSGSWADFPDGRRKMCAETLVPHNVGIESFVAIHCINKNFLRHINKYGVTAKASPELYF